MTTGAYTLQNEYREWSNWNSTNAAYGLYWGRSWRGDDSPTLHAGEHFYSGYRYSYQYDPLRWWQGSGTTVWTGNPNQYADSVVSTLGNGDWPTFVQVLSRMQEEVSNHSFNAAVAVAEGNKTLQMLFETASRVNRAFRQVRKGRVIGALKELGYRRAPGTYRSVTYSHDRVKASSGLFVNRVTKHEYLVTKQMQRLDPGSLLLELKYGWMPLYRDIYEAMKAFFAISNKGENRQFRVRITWKGPYYNPTARDCWAVNTVQHTASMKMVLTEDYPVWSALGLDDPLSVAWEKLPYSFVADWFAPVSSYLSARQFVNKVKGKYCRSWFERIRVLTKPEHCCPSGYQMYQAGWYTRQYVYLERTAWTDMASLRDNGIKFPGFRKWADNQTLTRCGVVVALIQQQVRSIGSRRG